MYLFSLNGVTRGLITSRPSKTCKTPYVADIVIDGDDTTEELCHSPSLGCCGLAEKGKTVILSKLTTGKTKCSHRVELAILTEERNPERELIIGINPKLGETIAELCLQKDCVLGLTNIQSYRRETKMLNSRFDFTGVDENGREFIMEVKSVPLADYVDVPKKERKNYKKEIEEAAQDDKISYFPDGYRKNSTAVVSPRALKHITELKEIVTTTDKRAILCFIIQRTDVKQFQPSNIDLVYKEAVIDAWKSGVEIKTLQVEWNREGECVFVRNDLPINLE
ncbi:DNA/RNA nuclease SfsA [Pelagibacteraceae bacterium]|nr:DNA/RNA nuclease SfsA [Pelagibacteraceae bacterium]